MQMLKGKQFFLYIADECKMTFDISCVYLKALFVLNLPKQLLLMSYVTGMWYFDDV